MKISQTITVAAGLFAGAVLAASVARADELESIKDNGETRIGRSAEFPSDWLALAFHTEKMPTWNLSYYYDEEFDRFADQVLKVAAVDREAAAKSYIAAQDRLMQNAVAKLETRLAVKAARRLVGADNVDDRMKPGTGLKILAMHGGSSIAKTKQWHLA
ncbi:hypothetical protein NKH48_36055 [Mesorhizobium sp. M1233]|uniref:hypothetical protein n=1 Tax=Mesorhizobium sp. M1233 TaxID=2957072 RepID=UPI00333C91FB